MIHIHEGYEEHKGFDLSLIAFVNLVPLVFEKGFYEM